MTVRRINGYGWGCCGPRRRDGPGHAGAGRGTPGRAGVAAPGHYGAPGGRPVDLLSYATG